MGIDYSVLWLIVFVGVTVGLIWLTSYLRGKKLITSEDLQFTMLTIGLTIEIVDQLNLRQESEIKKITSIVLNSLGFAIAIFKDEDVLKNAYLHAIELCEEYNIEVTPEREQIIKQLIDIAYKNKFWELNK
jgi:hypothetical protein